MQLAEEEARIRLPVVPARVDAELAAPNLRWRTAPPASAPQNTLPCQLLSLGCRTANQPNHVDAGAGVAVGAAPGQLPTKPTTRLSMAPREPA
jgi:hypothetical protein